jgi:hypothetical protein
MQDPIDQRGLSVIDVCDDRNIPDFLHKRFLPLVISKERQR